MPRQVLNAHGKLKILGNARMLNIETSVEKRMRHRIRLAAPLPLPDQTRQPAQRILIEAERLSDFSCRRLLAIAAYVGRHRRTKFAVALIHILNRLLALLFRRQIEIDVRPLAAALIQKALKQQFHTHRIDGRDLQRIADCRIRRAAASLNQDAVSLAVLDDVPDDQKIPGKPQPRDQGKFVLHLLLRPLQQWPVILRPIASMDSFCHTLAQKAIHRLSIRHRIARELVTEIVQFKLQPLR